MNKVVEKFAKVRSEFQQGGVEWLRMIVHCDSKEGVSVFEYDDLSQHCLYDSWFETAEEALAFAQRNYGVRQQDWEAADTLRARGIEIVAEQ